MPLCGGNLKGRFSELISRVKEDWQVEEGKEVQLEKGDMKALIQSAYKVFAPILFGVLLFFALIIFVFMLIWK